MIDGSYVGPRNHYQKLVKFQATEGSYKFSNIHDFLRGNESTSNYGYLLAFV
jgi:hypothetical protein